MYSMQGREHKQKAVGNQVKKAFSLRESVQVEIDELRWITVRSYSSESSEETEKISPNTRSEIEVPIAHYLQNISEKLQRIKI